MNFCPPNKPAAFFWGGGVGDVARYDSKTLPFSVSQLPKGVVNLPRG